MRLDYTRIAPAALATLKGVEQYVRQCPLEKPLMELVRLRASQINGCAYCINMHTRDARAAGETEQRLYLLSAWREAGIYSDREQAALAWTEALTLVSVDHVPDALYEQARIHFSDTELVDLTIAVIAINSWNRLAISFRSEVGTPHS
jgi:AhpD family alkylhydroperoxidase